MTGSFTPFMRRHPRWVLLLAVGFVALAAFTGAGLQSHLRSGGTTDPSSESALVTSRIESDSPGLDPNLVVLLHTPQGAHSSEAAAAAERLAAVLRDEPTATAVTAYVDDRDDLVAADDSAGLLTAHLNGDESDLALVLEDLRPALNEAAGALDVDLAGRAVIRETMDSTIAEDLLRAELIAIPLTFLLLLFVFGGFWAALMPLGVGVFAIITTNAALGVIARLTDVSVFALNLTTALGLGLAIDYALLILRRYREEIGAGHEHEAALTRTMSTAGRTVAFSGITVAISLAVLLVFPLYFLRSFAYAGIAVAITSMLGALVITPAAITLLRKRLAAPTRRTRHRPDAEGRWSATAGWASDHARLVAPITLLAMMALALPFASVHFGSSDHRQLQPDAEVRAATEQAQRDFPGAKAPFAVLAFPTSSTVHDVTRVSSAVAELPQIDGVSQLATTTGTLLIVRSDLDPMSQVARDRVADLREVAGPSAVGGATASLIDTETSIGQRLPLAIALVLLAALVLIFALSGSVVLPLVTVATNGLSLTAMFGAIVWVFQQGHLSRLLGFTPTGYVDVTLPALMACVAMALSLDYGVFVVARLVEEHRIGLDMRAVLTRALQRTGGVVSAAALILSTVLIAIGTSSITNTKMLGLGVALAVLIDATVVRGVIVPSVLTLLGRATWWAPRPLQRLHARWGWHEELPVDATDLVLDPVPDQGRHRAPALVG